MYRQRLFAANDPVAFSSRAIWEQGGLAWSGVLPSDPQFEIVWSEVGGEVVSAPILAPPVPEPTACDVPASDRRLRILRVRPERVRSLFGHDAADLAQHPRFALARLGPEWAALSRLSRSSELEAALIALGRAAPNAAPMVRSSVASLIVADGDPLRQIARESGYSYEQWLRTMKSTCGVIPVTLRSHARLKHAGALARSAPGLSMDEIAWRSGYSEASSLARAAMALGGQTFRQLSSSFTLPD